MVSLGETVAGLVSRRKGTAGRSRADRRTGLEEVRGFGFNPGELKLLAYVPPNLAKHAPLVVVLHGCSQSADDYAAGAGWLALAERFGFVVLAPEQARKNNANGCFNWFEPGDSARDRGEAASIHAMVRHLVRTHDLDSKRVFVTGLSAGGAMVAVLLATYPEVFAAGAVVAGLPFGVATTVQEAFGAMRGGTTLKGRQLGGLVLAAAPDVSRKPRLSIWHGLADSTVASANAQALARQWAAVHNLPEAPSEVQGRRNWKRSVWRDANGEPVVECNLIAGLGHGTPLATDAEDPIGEVGPFLLEAGIASSLEIARFWDLAPAEAWAPADVEEPQPHQAAHRSPVHGLAEGVMAAVSPHVSADVAALIARSLAKAGLMT